MLVLELDYRLLSVAEVTSVFDREFSSACVRTSLRFGALDLLVWILRSSQHGPLLDVTFELDSFAAVFGKLFESHVATDSFVIVRWMLSHGMSREIRNVIDDQTLHKGALPTPEASVGEVFIRLFKELKIRYPMNSQK